MDIDTLGEALGPLTSIILLLLLFLWGEHILQVHSYFFRGDCLLDHSETNASVEIQHHSGSLRYENRLYYVIVLEGSTDG